MKRWQKALQDNYGTPTIELVSGKGSVVKDANGNTYLDFLAGIATNVLGHAHPAIVKSVTKQISTLGHVSNFYAHPNVLELAEKLQKLTGDKQIIMKMLHFWQYFAIPLSNPTKIVKKIKKAKTIAVYDEAVAEILDNEREFHYSKISI